MVLAREVSVTIIVGADERTFLGVGTHVGFETARPIEALSAAFEIADVVP